MHAVQEYSNLEHRVNLDGCATEQVITSCNKFSDLNLAILRWTAKLPNLFLHQYFQPYSVSCDICYIYNLMNIWTNRTP